jgi:hypothetical protein
MSRRLVFRRFAEIELAEAVDWYEDQRTGLGDEFLQMPPWIASSKTHFCTKSSKMIFDALPCIDSRTASCMRYRRMNS